MLIEYCFDFILNAPVSTTHSIVGGVLGAGLAAAGMNIVNWLTMSKIAASWVISPVLGGIIAASFLFFITTKIINKKDKVNEDDIVTLFDGKEML